MLTLKNFQATRIDGPLFEPINATIPPGTAAHCLAPNGTGKTSLLKAIVGLLPATGQAHWNNQPTTEQRTQIHWIAHQHRAHTEQTVLAHIHHWQYLFQTHISKTRTQEALDTFQLTAYQDTPLSHLSAGNERKLCLLRLALIQRPLWLLDEPLTNLDTETQTVFTALLQRHLKEGGVSLLISHQPLTLPLTPLRLSAHHEKQ